MRKIDFLKFNKDIEQSALATNPVADLHQFVARYELILSELLDRHAPMKSRLITLRPNAPWYTDDLREIKVKRRQLKRAWIASGHAIDKQLFVDQCKKYRRMLEQAKCRYYRAKVVGCDTAIVSSC